jgi:putrescine aminotransferase
VEPVQGEGGIVSAPPGYLRGARDLCSLHGVAMIADEMQTGLGRSGRLFAVQREDVVPDILLLGKALGGGVEPISALLATGEIYDASQGFEAGSLHHTSAFGGNARSCAAAIAALDAVVSEHLAERAEELGSSTIASLRALARDEPLIREVRGQGLMIGIEFEVLADAGLPPSWRSHAAGTGLITGLVLMELRRTYRIIASPGFRNPAVLRVLPALNMQRDLLDYFVESLASALRWVRSRVQRSASGTL